MGKRKRMRSRFCSILLIVAMIVTMMPTAGFAELEVPGAVGGQAGTDRMTSSNTPAEGAGNHTPSDQTTACTCTELCTEGHVDQSCPVCSGEDADLAECVGGDGDLEYDLGNGAQVQYVVTAFNKLQDDVMMRTVPGRTPYADLNLPNTLEAVGYAIDGAGGRGTVQKATDANMSGGTDGNPAAGTLVSTGPVTIENVAWELLAENNGGVTVYDEMAEEGTYVFTPVFTGAYQVTAEAKADLPQIWVRMGTAETFAFSGGDGSEANPFMITYPGDLVDLASAVNSYGTGNSYAGKHFKLTNDIDMAGVKWTPIGRGEDKFFSGIFDGGGNRIENISVDQNQYGQYITYAGFFGSIRYAEVRNLEVTGSVKGYIFVGGVVGSSYASTVESCRNECDIAGSELVGGVVGITEGSTIRYCSNAGSITVEKDYGPNAPYSTGGITGSVYGVDERDSSGNVVKHYDGLIECCYNTGDITGSIAGNVGGIAGSSKGERNESETKKGTTVIKNCYNTGDITADNQTVGGIVGSNGYETVEDCYNIGDVRGTEYVGGIVASGSAESAGPMPVSGCVSLGTIVEGREKVAGVLGGKGSSVAVTLPDCKSREDTVISVGGEQKYAGTWMADATLKEENYGVKQAANGTEDQSSVFSMWDDTVWNIPSGTLGVGNELPTLIQPAHEGAAPVLPARRDLEAPAALYYDPATEKLYTSADFISANEYTDSANAGKWRGEGNTLILNGFTFDTTEIVALTMPAGAAIQLEPGSVNKISNKTVNHTVSGGKTEVVTVIYCDGDLTIKGTGSSTVGSLELAAGGCNNPGIMNASNGVAGVRAQGRLTVDGVRVIAGVGSYNRSEGSNGYVINSAVKCGGDVVIKNGADFTAESSTNAGNGVTANRIVFTGTNDFVSKGMDKAVSLNSAIDETTIDQFQGATNYLGSSLEGIENFNFDVSSKTYGYKPGGTAKYIKIKSSVFDVDPDDGSYLIKTKEDLQALSRRVEEGNSYSGKTFKQVNDIDLENEIWTPVGTNGAVFKAVYDGGGHLVSGLRVETAEYAGLFGYIEDGRVENLGVSGSVSGTYQYTGGIAGYINNSVISNCYNTAVISGSRNMGGIVGESVGTSRIEDCYNTGDITKKGDYAGGIAGAAYGTIARCYNIGDIYDKSASENGATAGGVTGFARSILTLENCVSLGRKITAKSDFGRVAGYKYSSTDLKNNKARSDMLVGKYGAEAVVSSSDATDANGLDIVLNIPQSSVFASWPADTWDIPAGNLAIGKALPVLKKARQAEAPKLPGDIPPVTLYYNQADGKLYTSGVFDPVNLYDAAADGNDGKWSGNGSTLTMDGFVFESTAPVAMVVPAGTVIRLAPLGGGTNAADSRIRSSYSGDGTASAGNVDVVAALRTDGALTVEGSGKLTLASGENTNNGTTTGTAALVCGNLVIDRSTLHATGGASAAGNSRGIWSSGSVTLKNKAEATAISDASSAGNGCAGIDAAETIVFTEARALTAKGNGSAVILRGGAVQENWIGEKLASVNYNGSGATDAGLVFDAGNHAYTVGGTAAKYIQFTGKPDFEGSGTSDDPWKIKDTDDLESLGDNVSSGKDYKGEHFEVTGDIDLTGKGPWTPIGTEDHPFEGDFDGGGHEITGVPSDETKDGQGLFGKVGEDGIVENLGVTGDVNGKDRVGGVAADNEGTVRNCYNTGDITGTGDHVGGLVGINRGTIKNCYNTGRITSGTGAAGGITGSTGHNENAASVPQKTQPKVSNCYNTGGIAGADGAGGIAGKFIDMDHSGKSSRVDNNDSLGLTVTADSGGAGRVVGYAAGAENVAGAGMSDNKARKDQKTGASGAEGTVTGGAGSNKDGADVTVAVTEQAGAGGVFDPAQGWDTADIWTVPDKKLNIGESLPVLKKATQVPAPVLPGSIAVTLYYNSADGKLYKDETFTNKYEDGNQGKWSGAGSVLTLLNGFDFSTEAAMALVMPAGGVVKLEEGGRIKITSAHTGQPSSGNVAALYGKGNLTVKGGGTLTLLSGENTAADGVSAGLYVSGALETEGAALVSTGGKAKNSYGIYSGGDITVKKKAAITAASDKDTSVTDGYGAACGGTGTIKFPDRSGTVVAQGKHGAVSLKGGAVPADSDIAMVASAEYDGTNAAGSQIMFDGAVYGYRIGNDAARYLRMEGYTADYSGGAGKEENPYIIKTSEDLERLADELEKGHDYKDRYFEVDDNAGNLTATEPIGTAEYPFDGVFDGKGNLITIHTGGSGKDDQGLFGVIGENGVVKNCGIAGSVTGGSNVGGVAGTNNGKIESCYNTARIDGSGSRIGGIAGWNKGTGSISDCYNTGNISGFGSGSGNPAEHGGLVGGLTGSNDGALANCYNTGLIYGTVQLGGIAGANAGSVTDCMSLGLLVSGSAGDSDGIGRVAGVSSGALKGNRSRSDLKIGEKDKEETATVYQGANQLNGADVAADGTIAEEAVFSAWSAGSRWDIPQEKLEVSKELPVLKAARETPAPTLPGDAGKLGVITVKLSAGNNKVTLAAQPVSGEFMYFYKTTGSDDAANKPSYNTPVSGSWTRYEEAVEIAGVNGTRIYVQVVRVNRQTQKIQAWGQSSAVPTDGKGGDGNGSDGSDGSGGSGGSGGSNGIHVTGYAGASSELGMDGLEASMTVTVQAIDNGISDARNRAGRVGVTAGSISVIVLADTDLKADTEAADAAGTTASDKGMNAVSLSVSLPGAAQNAVISKGVANLAFGLGESDLTVGFNLKAVREVRRQAGTDVQVKAVRLDNAGLTGAVRSLAGNRPVYEVTADYATADGTRVRIENLGEGKMFLEIPYRLQQGETAGTICGVAAGADGGAFYVDRSSYDPNRQVLVLEAKPGMCYGVSSRPVLAAAAAGHWGRDDIEFAASRGLLPGMGAAEGNPDAAVTRGMFVTALGRLSGINPDEYRQNRFSDVPADAYYAPYVEWAVQKNIAAGISKTAFAPDQPLTREQQAVIMYKYNALNGNSAGSVYKAVAFADGNEVSAAAAGAVSSIQQAGVMMCRDGSRFDPQAETGLAEAAATLRRYVERCVTPVTARSWQKNDSGHLAFYEAGKPLTGWQQLDGKWRYFYGDGAMAVSTVIDGYEIGPDGIMKSVQAEKN